MTIIIIIIIIITTIVVTIVSVTFVCVCVCVCVLNKYGILLRRHSLGRGLPSGEVRAYFL